MWPCRTPRKNPKQAQLKSPSWLLSSQIAIYGEHMEIKTRHETEANAKNESEANVTSKNLKRTQHPAVTSRLGSVLLRRTQKGYPFSSYYKRSYFTEKGTFFILLCKEHS